MHRVSLQEKELSCPVCIDIFEEPKALPECAHNVCEKCLESIATMSRWQCITCPVCRVQSYLPPGGVAKIPTNRFMKTVIDGLPGRKEVRSMKRAVEQCEEGLRSSKSHIDDCDRSIVALKTAQQNAHQVKKEIADHTKYLIDIIQKESTRLTAEVDERIETTSSLLTKLRRERKKTSYTVKESEKIVSETREIIERGNTQEIIDKKDESVSKLQVNTAILAIDYKFDFPDVPTSIHFTRANQDHTGGQILGWISKDCISDEYTDHEYLHDWFPIPSRGRCFGRFQPMIAEEVSSPPPRRSSLPLHFTGGSNYQSLVGSRSRFEYTPLMKLPPLPPPRRS